MNDLISRQAAIDAFNTDVDSLIVYGTENAVTVKRYINGVLEKIKQLPPIQPVNNSENPNSSDVISRQAAIDRILATGYADQIKDNLLLILRLLPPAQPEIIRCKDCKHNPKYEWFGCPMSHLSEKQRPETAWCWKAERRTDERSD